MGQNILVSTPLISWEHFLNLLEEYLEVDDGKNIEIVSKAKLLAAIITDKLTWDRNTEEIV